MYLMSRSLYLFGSIALMSLGPTSLAMAQELPPACSLPNITYEFDPGAALDEAPYMSDFECLILGENYMGAPACEYYKAVIAGPQTADKISEVCFKELTSTGIPREYKADNIHRMIIEMEPVENDRFGGSTALARIVSRDLKLNDSKWYETTTVALYDCGAAYDGKSYN